MPLRRRHAGGEKQDKNTRALRARATDGGAAAGNFVVRMRRKQQDA
jgi:hypothetical protein